MCPSDVEEKSKGQSRVGKEDWQRRPLSPVYENVANVIHGTKTRKEVTQVYLTLQTRCQKT